MFWIKGGNVTLEDFLKYNTVIETNISPINIDDNHKLYYQNLPSSGILIPFIMKLMKGKKNLKLKT